MVSKVNIVEALSNIVYGSKALLHSQMHLIVLFILLSLLFNMI